MKTLANLSLASFLGIAAFVLWAISQKPVAEVKPDHATVCAVVRSRLTLTPPQIAQSMLVAYGCN